MADAPNVRAAVSINVGDCTIESRPLPFTRAEDIQADVYGLLVKVVKRLVEEMGIVGVQKIAALATADDVTGDQLASIIVAILPALDTLFDNLRGGELKRLAPLLLFSTTVVYPDPENGKKTREELALVVGREKVFDAMPSLYWVSLFHAGRVTFARFFPGSGLAGLLKKTSAADA